MIDCLSIKIGMFGDTNVGKSTMLEVLRQQNINIPNVYLTIGVDYMLKKYTHDDIIFRLQVWDTAGQEKFRSISESYFRGINVPVFAFDLSDRSSFTSINRWISSYNNSRGSEPLFLILVGNKSDLERSVSEGEINKSVSDHGFCYYETNKDNLDSINKVFDNINDKLYSMHQKNLLNIDFSNISLHNSSIREGRLTSEQGGMNIMENDNYSLKKKCCR